MILTVGCGFLGSYVVKQFSEKTNEKIAATVRSKENIIPVKGVEYITCDVTDSRDLTALAEKCRGESLTVIYLAACHNIDYVYENPAQASEINIDALENFLAAMPNITKLFFASTDCVYGESNSVRFNESSPLNPVNEYGRQKIRAEEIVLRHGFTVLRLPFLIGPSMTTKPHFYDRIRRDLENNKAVEMIDGLGRSVLSFSKAAGLIYRLSLLDAEKLPPVINLCGDDTFTKYETGLLLARHFSAPESLIAKISEDEGNKFFKDKRASCTAMDNSLVKTLLGTEKISWEEEICS